MRYESKMGKGDTQNMMDHNVVRFVMLASYNDSKGQLQVINAVSEMNDLPLGRLKIDFWGSGTEEYTRFLSKKINDRGLENTIRLMGYTEDTWDVLKSYDVGINCSYMEAFGRSTIEYLAMGMPVIASDCGSNPELISDESKGIIFEYNNKKSLIDAIEYMVLRFADYKRNSIRLRRYAVDCFSAEKNAEKFVSHIKMCRNHINVDESMKI